MLQAIDPPRELTVASVLQGAHRDDGTGWSMWACDADRDGRDEVVVGAPYHDYSEEIELAGRVYWVDDVPH